MDIDRYIAKNQPTWLALRDATARVRSRRHRVTAAELTEFISLYQRSSTHLAHIQATYSDPQLLGQVTNVVADASSALYSSRPSAGRALREFFTQTVPMAMWGLRRFIAVAAIAMFLPALVFGVWFANSEQALDIAVDDVTQRALLQSEFENYYSSAPAEQFATEVLINNIQVSFYAFAAGIFFSVGAIVILAFNGVNLGVAAGLFHFAGEAPKFWGLILPHGLIELTAAVVAGAAGIRIGWSLIAPGDRPRMTALAETGRQAIPVLLGLIPVFIVAGVVEAFVTPSGLPTIARVGIGVLVEVVFVAYVVLWGRQAEIAQARTTAFDHALPGRR